MNKNLKDYNNKKNTKKFNKLLSYLTISIMLLAGTSIQAQANNEKLYENMGEKIVQFQENIRVDTESINILGIALNIKDKYNSKYTGLSQTVAINEKLFPKKMVDNYNQKPINNWKGDVTVAAAATGPSKKDNSSFTITYKNVSKISCPKLISNLESNFSEISVNNKIVKNDRNIFNIKETNNICNTTNSNKIAFTSF